MSMIDAIKNFPKQFEYEPEIVNSERPDKYKKFIVAGMGGSNLAPEIIRNLNPMVSLISHKNYGLPEVGNDTLMIISSYSGNTEEAIDGFNEAFAKKLPMAVIAAGGKLLSLAQENNIPYIQIPDTGIQPRSALGFSILAFSKLMGLDDLLKELRELNGLNPSDSEKQGKALAKNTRDHVPVVYASNNYSGLAYNWKIKFNETGKIPAFYNLIPELNHNEMTGFDVQKPSRHLSQNFHFLFLRDQDDDQRIKKRFEVLERLYKDRGLRVDSLELRGASKAEKLFSSLILADWTAYYTAQLYGHEPESVSMVEEFKRLL